MGVTTNDEKIMYEKAINFAETSKNELSTGYKYIISNISLAKEEVIKMSNLKTDELENYLLTNNQTIFDRIMDSLKIYENELKEDLEFFPGIINDIERINSIIELLEKVIDKNKNSGWGIYENIVTVLKIWLLKLFYVSYKKPTLLGIILDIGITLSFASLYLVGNVVGEVVKNAKVNTENAKRANITAHKNTTRTYRNRCWNCHSGITEENTKCYRCGWYRCSTCGSCMQGCSTNNLKLNDFNDVNEEGNRQNNYEDNGYWNRAELNEYYGYAEDYEGDWD